MVSEKHLTFLIDAHTSFELIPSVYIYIQNFYEVNLF